MFSLVNWFRKRHAIKKYVKVLGPELKKRFGKKRVYRAVEVINTAKGKGLSERHINYALALYCTNEEYNATPAQPDSISVEYASARAIAMNIAISTVLYSSSGDSNLVNTPGNQGLYGGGGGSGGAGGGDT